MPNRLAARKALATKEAEGLATEQSALDDQLEERVVVMRREAALFTGKSLSVLNQETEDRKENESVRMYKQLKQELVDAAMASLVQQVKEDSSIEHEMAYITQFVNELEKPS